MAARHQGFDVCALGLCPIAAHHIAYRINGNLIKTTVQHLGLDLGGTGPVCVREVSDGELAFFRVAGIGVHAQRLMPVPHIIAQAGRDAKFVVKAKLHDAVDVAQALGQLKFGMVGEPPLKRLENLPLGQPRAARAAHRQHKRKAEAGAVSRVQALDARQLIWRAVGQARFGLLVGGFGGKRVAHHGLASEFGVGANQGELGVAVSFLQDLRHGVLELCQRSKGPLQQGGGGNPRGVLVQAAKQVCGLFAGGRVELVQGDGHGHGHGSGHWHGHRHFWGMG